MLVTLGLLLLALSEQQMSAAEILPGDRVVVIRPTTWTTTQGSVERITVGTTLLVESIDGASVTASAGKVGSLDLATVVPLPDALEEFAESLTANPRDALALLGRGKLLLQQGKLDEAIADFDSCLLLAPSESEAHTYRGWAWKRKGDNERALADFDRAIELNPRDALACRVRGATWASKKNYLRALSQYTESLQIDPDNPDTLNHRAILQSACEDPQVRDGRNAVTDATRACELSGWKIPLYLGNLAAAYAELGDFDQAISWQEKAISLSPSDRSKIHQERLALYRQQKPFRTTWRRRAVVRSCRWFSAHRFLDESVEFLPLRRRSTPSSLHEKAVGHMATRHVVEGRLVHEAERRVPRF